uniref:HTH psq-type domain-containing protein n=1 Tax=Amphimedon queenslandica TaxID=400682 RepID=A0A1X7UV72_AMPQE
MACKRKYWSQQAMEQAVASVESDAMGLREAARCYNVPVETLRRRVKCLVPVECKPGPPTVLSKEEEDQLYEYLINMADMGYGITKGHRNEASFCYCRKNRKETSLYR